MMRSTFSTTTMASSTSRPIASTIANMVRMLIVKPAASSTAKVPSSTTGTASVGTSVARKFCRNRYMTRKTSTIASSRSEEHTSELQSLMRNSYAVFCLKKKNNKKTTTQDTNIGRKEHQHN